MMGGRADEELETAIGSVSVGAEDVTGVALVGTKGTAIRGHVVVQPAAAATGIKPSEISVNLMPTDPDAAMSFMGGGFRDGLEDDWSFELRAIQSPVLLRSFRLPAGYSLKAVLNNGADVTDTGISFRQGETVSGLQVIISTSGSAVSGTVTDDGGKPLSDYAVIVYADDPVKWGFMSRRVMLARPDQQGGFLAKNLPPGRYLAVAVDAVEDGQESDPEFLERMRTLATPFGLADGERRALTLKRVQAY
jgi:hypothetical protein